jgi:hypothetical protein
MCRLWSQEKADVTPPSVSLDLGLPLPRAGIPRNTKHPAGCVVVLGSLTVLHVRRTVNHPKIAKPVVSGHAIYVVHLSVRPRATCQQDGDTMSS